MDDKLVQDIIRTAVDATSHAGVESVITTPPPKSMNKNQFQKKGITKKSLIEAFLKNPRVISAEHKDGQFHIHTEEGTIHFKFVFED